MSGHSFVKAGLVLAALAGSAGATTLLREDLGSLSRSADVIARGSVTRVWSVLSRDRTRGHTKIEVRLIETLKGSAPETLNVDQPGGEVDGVGTHVSGALCDIYPRGQPPVTCLSKVRRDVKGEGNGTPQVIAWTGCAATGLGGGGMAALALLLLWRAARRPLRR